MALEAVAALAVAIAALWLVLHPLVRPPGSRWDEAEPVDPEETPKGIALAALKEIEFDRETGKLSDADYALLKDRYTIAALDALRAEEAAEASDDLEAMIAARLHSLRSAPAATSSNTSVPPCATCGPRPEPDAIFCSACGCRLESGVGSRESGAGSQETGTKSSNYMARALLTPHSRLLLQSILQPASKPPPP